MNLRGLWGEITHYQHLQMVHMNIDNRHPHLDWKLLSATGPNCVFESEELKIHSDHSATIWQTIEEICTGSSSKFEECFLCVKEGVCAIKGESNTKEPCFRKMYLFLVEKLPELIKSLPVRLNDPILWQVAIVDLLVLVS